MAKGKKGESAKDIKKAVAKAVKKEAKVVKHEAKKQPEVKVVLQRAKETHPTVYAKAVKDPVFLKYFDQLVYPDKQGQVGVPDGSLVPTAVSKSIQTLDVIANFNATSITNGDGGRFAFHIAPNAGQGQTDQDGYIQINTGYVNCSSDNLTAEVNTKLVLAVKAAAIMPSVAWAPGYVTTAALSKEKKRKSVSEDDSDPDGVKKLVRDLKLANNLKDPVKRTHGLRLESDYNNAAYEYWLDPLTSVMAGPAVSTGTQNINNINGVVTQIRPVAMSVWFQCSKPELDNGGSIACGLLPAGSTYGQIIPVDWAIGASAGNFTGYGPLQNWENLAQVPGTYQGKLKDGCYCWWTPQRISDLQMNSLAECDMEDYPTIMVAGQWAPNAGETVNAASALIGRLRIVTLYEYTGQQQIITQAYQGCSIGFLERTKMLLHGQPTAMANGTHLAWIKKIVSTAAGALVGFAGGGPGGAMAGAELGWKAGKTWAGE